MMISQSESRVVKTTPPGALREAVNFGRCIVGVSVGNPEFEGGRFAKLLNWVETHFESCTVLVGDLLQRFNYQITDHNSEEKAVLAATAAGDSWLGRNQHLIDSVNCEVRACRWIDVISDPAFHKILKSLEDYISISDTLNSALTRDVESFIRRKTRQGTILPGTEDRARRMSRQYITEETAAFALLAANGWHVDIYPGQELSTLRELIMGNHDDQNFSLKNWINVEVRFPPAESLQS